MFKLVSKGKRFREIIFHEDRKYITFHQELVNKIWTNKNPKLMIPDAPQEM